MNISIRPVRTGPLESMKELAELTVTLMSVTKRHGRRNMTPGRPEYVDDPVDLRRESVDLMGMVLEKDEVRRLHARLVLPVHADDVGEPAADVVRQGACA